MVALKVTSAIDAMIRANQAETVLPLQEAVARLRADVDELKRERVVPELSAKQSKQKPSKSTGP
jgi:cell division protein FtsB